MHWIVCGVCAIAFIAWIVYEAKTAPEDIENNKKDNKETT